jgi:hypothetical protein
MRLATIVTLAALVATPAFAQSSAPEFGSGNVPSAGYGQMARGSFSSGGMGAYAQVNPGSMKFKSGKHHHGRMVK